MYERKQAPVIMISVSVSGYIAISVFGYISISVFGNPAISALGCPSICVPTSIYVFTSGVIVNLSISTLIVLMIWLTPAVFGTNRVGNFGLNPIIGCGTNPIWCSDSDSIWRMDIGLISMFSSIPACS